jgi:hypothetical protein
VALLVHTENLQKIRVGCRQSVQQWSKGQKNIDTGVKSRVLCTVNFPLGRSVIITTTTENIRIVVGGGGGCGKG